jgi:hypothetical protein
LAIWVIGALVCDSAPEWEYNSTLGFNVRRAGSQQRYRSEGGAISHFAAWGLNPVTAGAATGTAMKVFMHGDSFVEALQVTDGDKPDAQLTRALIGGRPSARAAVVLGLGSAGASGADYYYRIPAWERALGAPAAHVIISQQVDDFLPGSIFQHHSRFLDEPRFRLVEDSESAVSPRKAMIARWINRLRLEVVVQIAHRWRTARKEGLRFRVGPLPLKEPPLDGERRTADKERAAFDYMFSMLRRQTAQPILVVYCPPILKLRDGAVQTTDVNADSVERLEQCARAQGVDFLTVGPDLLRLYEREGRLPYGFPNSKPGSGHWNADGIRAAMTAVAKHLREDYAAFSD